MPLKYHQATYELLTQTQIDTKEAIESYTQYRSMYPLEQQTSYNPIAWTELDLFQHPITFSEENIAHLDDLERHYKIKLPEAVREWFSLDIMPKVMTVEGSTFDIALKPVENTTLWQFMWSEYIDQGGEEIVFDINEGDDPPVFAISVDTPIKIASTFSELILMYFWDWYAKHQFPYGFRLLYINSNPYHYLPLEKLTGAFHKLEAYRYTRFFNDHVRIIGFTVEAKDQTLDQEDVLKQGTFRADNIDTLRSLIFNLWDTAAPVFHIFLFWNNVPANVVLEMQREVTYRLLVKANDWIVEDELAKSLNISSPRSKEHLLSQIDYLFNNGQIEVDPVTPAENSQMRRFRVKSGQANDS